ncbi:RNA polymerase III transcription initiation factor complex subunit [Komagataella phaffii CBS 7435]|uniref:One of six subunits of the RNA polymerase III transcription initiation factor complex (TFIIIC) n=2 Tax=Komagataella phaffii TaxID=460519 RepID=C4QWX2_KOMPG|nr:One of six subunits of the RNA polymerase III transcription initiation factor complex (TFIIIC) [Komagataella phaffii GS115]AOA61013.1 GQ67_02953T0 [Komagataella phaffii]CAH2446539.1 RNA polymerase III transcription initiation factor complex subunit [Komagataella phaffii CBS 7435]AOA66520.1 GQ68_02294T0 [Komagataella phaffii GS115]CAY67745.1 One of six subunits of the RNA polymerase III transcription initiation factor complex (TFIIIC) [Komagataella phaffii GS115]CCA36832.1 RNA polymerase III
MAKTKTVDKELDLDDDDDDLFEGIDQLKESLEADDLDDEDYEEISQDYDSDDNAQMGEVLEGQSENFQRGDYLSSSRPISANPAIELGFSDDEELDPDLIDDDADFREALREASNFKPKRKTGGMAAMKRRMRKDRELDPEVRMLLSQANEAFVRGDLQVAQETYGEVIKKDSKSFSAYKTLGEIYKIQGLLNKCVTLWIIAAHLHSWDSEFWSMVAELSYQLGHTSQAIYCYSRGISASDHKDLKAIFDRAVIYREVGQYGRASESFQKLFHIMPTNSTILKELALVYLKQKRISDAIALYKKVFEENKNYRQLIEEDPTSFERLQVPQFGWSELNILSELCSKQGAWRMGISDIKTIARWIQRRESETFWQDQKDDSEFDDRRRSIEAFKALPEVEKQKSHNLPIDIRIQLGFFRLRLKENDEALIHFGYLMDSAIENTADLYLEVGTSLEKIGLFHEALKFLSPLSELEPYHNVELIMIIARCLVETEDYTQAKAAYLSLAQNDPDNIDVLLSLAEVCFHLGENEEANQLFVQIESKKEQLALEDFENEADETMVDIGSTGEPAEPIIDQALILESSRRKGKKRDVYTKDEIADMEQSALARVAHTYSRLKRLGDEPKEKGNFVMKAWLEIAADLIEMFLLSNIFISREKVKRFLALMNRKRTQMLKVGQKITRMKYVREETELARLPETKKLRNTASQLEEFRGLKISEWSDIFFRYCLALASYDDSEEVLMLVEVVKGIEIFTNTKQKTTLVNLLQLSVALQMDDNQLINSTIRNLLVAYQFNSEVFRIFMTFNKSSNDAINVYSDSINSKFFLRQLKAHDSLRLGKKIVGMANLVNQEVDSTRINPYLYHIYSTLLFSKRSYTSSLGYEIKVYREFREDPLICLIIGVSYLNRSIQRVIPNRHFEVLQAFTYFLEYQEIREKKDGSKGIKMETVYNIGRAFHFLGLTTMAIPYYEEVLAMEPVEPDYNLKMEAGYNLANIYNMDGNFQAARRVMEEHLVIN